MSAKQDFQIRRWQCLIKEFKESGMKLNKWCANNGVTKDQYYYWLRKVQLKYYEVAVKQLEASELSCKTAIVSDDKASQFVEISPDTLNEAFKQASVTVAVVQKDNIRIEIMPNASASFIRQLLTAVQYA
jgi:predicted site-specific integrase-resolvase